MRASAVLMPGFTLITATVPLPPISLARLSAASLPPPMLSVLIRDTPSEELLDVVSTKKIFVPSFWIRCSSGSRALASVGATMSASGLLAATELRIGACSLTEKSAGPVTRQFRAECLGLRLGTALHGDVEVIALGSDHELEVLLRRWGTAAAAAAAASAGAQAQADGRDRGHTGDHRGIST